MFSNGFALAAAALALALPLPASAVVLVGGEGPAVTVDTSVLDGSRRLDLPAGSGGLLMPGERVAPGGRVHLVPPGQKPSQKLTLVPPSGSARSSLLPGSKPVVLTPPSGVKPMLAPPRQKKAPSAAEIEAEVNAQAQPKAAAAPKPSAAPKPAPAPVLAPPPAVAAPVVVPAPVAPPPAEPSALPEPTPIAPVAPPAAASAPPVPAAPEVPPPPAVAAPAPEPAPTPAPPRVAALAPPATPAVPAAPAPSQAVTPSASIALLFEPEDARLNETHRALLKDVVARLSEDPEANVQLLAYAQGDNRSKARRLSLSRALAVRSYLLSQDVRNTRIEVRALGDQLPVSGGKPDRVDVVIEKP